jgi:hypothetical protein
MLLPPSSRFIELLVASLSSEYGADKSRLGISSQVSIVKAPISLVKPGDPMTSTTSQGLNVNCWLAGIDPSP